MDKYKLEEPISIKVKWNWTPTFTHEIPLENETLFFCKRCILIGKEAYYIHDSEHIDCSTDSSKNYTTTRHVVSGGWRRLMDYHETVDKLKQDEFDKLIGEYPVIVEILKWVEKQ